MGMHMLLFYLVLIFSSLFAVISRYDLFISNPIKNLNFIDAIADIPIHTKGHTTSFDLP
jgi:hypothetical protein